ncbi:hypothetical protein BJ875DRAFT_459547 [Amylocarpus encephaloides]|uniref:G domain-containing protein n=1 Tax=Amylocarpus encephaloides TaxID=45428 RepID=A0A9P7YKJ1_9HELO|nr:hypothetical protein BJ875DRAFT_459547 [Amylocarpus encephaloides]
MTQGHDSGSLRIARPGSDVRNPAETIPTTNQEQERNIQNAVKKGKALCISLVDSLKQSSLADNEESNLHAVISLAEELRDFQSPTEFAIGLVGDSGVGKSSLINSLLETESLAKAGGGGSACTTVVTEYRQKRDGDSATYTIEIESMKDELIQDILRQSVIDYRRYHLLDRDASEMPDHVELEKLEKNAKFAWDTIIGAFGDRNDCSNLYFGNPRITTDEAIGTLMSWKDDIIWPQNNRITTHLVDDASQCTSLIDDSLKALKWPLIEVVRVFLDAQVLKNGIVLVDLPGLRDVNAARVRITEDRLYQCDEVFVVTEIGRAVTNRSVEEVMVRLLGMGFSKLKRSQGVAIICTKSESFVASEILRDIPATATFNQLAMRDLKRRIEDRENNDLPFGALKAEKKHLFIAARNDYVESQLTHRYATQSLVRSIRIFCVSNTLYSDAIAAQTDANRRRSSINVTDDKVAIAKQKMITSGIPQLQDYVRGIPSESQIAETRHFLKTRILTLFEKSEMWLNANVQDMAAAQPAAPEFVLELQENLGRNFRGAVETCSGELDATKEQFLRQPLARGVQRWTNAALVAVSKWERVWGHQTVLAFWNHDGAHVTGSVGWNDWNEEIIQAMVDNMESSEGVIHDKITRSFDNLKGTVFRELDTLPLRLGEILRVETLPRRRRELDYELLKLTDGFNNQMQIIYHNLLKTHGSSYVMQYMLPMYAVIDHGTGVTKRRFVSLKSRIEGQPKLFAEIATLCTTAVTSTIVGFREKLYEILDKCHQDIKADLDIVSGENIAANDPGYVTASMYEVLEDVSKKREAVLSEFERCVRSARA